MEEFIQSLITQIPNLAVAVWVIRRDGITIEKLLEIEKWMIEQLMALHPPQDVTPEQIE